MVKKYQTRIPLGKVADCKRESVERFLNEVYFVGVSGTPGDSTKLEIYQPDAGAPYGVSVVKPLKQVLVALNRLDKALGRHTRKSVQKVST
jgi:hypothetical protein